MNRTDNFFEDLKNSKVVTSILSGVGIYIIASVVLAIIIICVVLCVSGSVGLIVFKFLKNFQDSMRIYYG